jgi:hypothetical protein
VTDVFEVRLAPRFVIAVLLAAAAVAGALAGSPVRASAPEDLDALMQRVIARRDENWQTLQQYSVEESERFDVNGPDNMPVWGERREYAWFVRDGYFIRSPLRVNGVTLSDGERRKAEAEYLKRAEDRDKQRAKPGGASATTAGDKTGVPTDVQGLIEQSRKPGVMRSAIFLRFKFEEGRYSFVGRETFEGLDVLRIEYYPERLLTREQARGLLPPRGNANRPDPKSAAIAAMINKGSLITIWVEPVSHQIVRYEFKNASLGFLPAPELVRVEDLRSAMTMSRPIAGAPDVWLPRDIDYYFNAMVASGSLNARYRIDYRNYRKP